MTETTKYRSRYPLNDKQLGRMLDNIFFTQQLIDELHAQRDNMKNKVFLSGIKYENGEYIIPENANEFVKDLAFEAQKLEESITKATGRLIRFQRMATSLINKVPDYRARLVLIKRYIDNKGVETIAEEMNYSPRHVQRMLKEATELVETAYNEEKAKKRENTPSV